MKYPSPQDIKTMKIVYDAMVDQITLKQKLYAAAAIALTNDNVVLTSAVDNLITIAAMIDPEAFRYFAANYHIDNNIAIQSANRINATDAHRLIDRLIRHSYSADTHADSMSSAMRALENFIDVAGQSII